MTTKKHDMEQETTFGQLTVIQGRIIENKISSEDIKKGGIVNIYPSTPVKVEGRSPFQVFTLTINKSVIIIVRQ